MGPLLLAALLVAADPEPEAPAPEAAAQPTEAPAADPQKPRFQRALRVATYDLETESVEPAVARVLTDSLVAELRKLERLSVIGMDEVREMLAHEVDKQLLGCNTDDSCLVELAGAIGADNLVTGKLVKVGDEYALVLRRTDQRQGAVVATVNRRLRVASDAELLLAVGPAVEELFPDTVLKPGAQRGVGDEIVLRLDPPPVPRWAFWTGAGAAGGAAILGATFGLLARNAEARRDLYVARGQDEVIDAAELGRKTGRAEAFALTANVFFVSAAVLAVATGVSAPFVDWQGHGEAR